MGISFAAVLTACLVIVAPARAADQIPPCGVDDSLKTIVGETLHRAISAYRALGKALPIESVVVNPTTRIAPAKTLNVFVVQDATQGYVNAEQCSKGPLKKREPLDTLSVRGGCVVVAVDRMEMRCSSDAVKIFGYVGQRSDIANPVLLYLLVHEPLTSISGEWGNTQVARSQSS